MNKNDIVYRDQIIDTLKKNMPYAIFDDDGNYTTRGMRLLDVISAVPAAQSQYKKGKWIKISPANIYECSKCGKNVMTDDISAYDFCHGCGADMRSENNVSL